MLWFTMNMNRKLNTSIYWWYIFSIYYKKMAKYNPISSNHISTDGSCKKKKQHVFTELMVKRSLKKTENRRPTALVKINIWTRCSYLPRSYCDKRHYVKYVFYFYLKTYYLCVITYNVYNTFFKYPLGFYSKTLKINVVTYVKVSKIIMDEYLCTSINITW